MPKSKPALKLWKEIMSWKDQAAPHHLSVREQGAKTRGRFAPTDANQDARAHEAWASLAARGALQNRLQNPPPAMDFQGQDLESLLPDLFDGQDLQAMNWLEDAEEQHVSSSVQASNVTLIIVFIIP